MDMNNEIQSEYDDLQVRRNAAYAAFSSIYDSEHPKPAKGQATDVGRISLIFQILIMAASIYVSGSRTVAEFDGGAGCKHPFGAAVTWYRYGG